MIWIILVTLYLILGFRFEKPDDWNLIKKISAHVMWLPMFILILFVLREYKSK